MTNKYQELGELLKAYTHPTTDVAQKSAHPLAKGIAEEQDRRAFGTYLSAAIDNSSLTRAQIAQTTNISEVTLYGFERGLIPASDVDRHVLQRLANVIGEDVATFRLLLGNQSSSYPRETTTIDGGEPLNVHRRLPMSTEHPPIPVSEQTHAPPYSPKRRFRMPIGLLPSFAMGGAAAVIIVVLMLNPQLINRLIGVDTGPNTGSSTELSTTIPAATSLAVVIQQGNSVIEESRTLSQAADEGEQSGAVDMASTTGVFDTSNNVASADMSATNDLLDTSENSASTGMAATNSSLDADEDLAVAAAPAQAMPLNNAGTLGRTATATVMSRPTIATTPMPQGTQMAVTIAQLQVGAAATATTGPQMGVVQNENETLAETAYPAPASASELQITPTPAYPPPLPPTRVPAHLPPAMTFIDYGINAFTETAMDNLSTFSVDVDTGSYTIARRYISEGSLPPQEAVRVEEFVNYFDYGYEQPAQDQVFAIHMGTYPSPFTERRVGAEEAGDVQLMRIGIQGYDIEDEQRPDVALTFVIDVSGSMSDGGRLTLVKRALTMLVEQLRPSDTIGIVVYSTDARVLLQPTKASSANTILDAIFKLQPENSTNVAAGLSLGYDMAWRNFDDRAINRIILASDGVANVDATDPNQIWAQAAQYADKGITLNSIGVGMGNYNDVIMEQLADMGDGVYGYVDSIEEAERLFVDELTGTLVTIAKDAKVQVEFNPEAVVRYRLIGYENRDVADADFRNDTVDAGEIGAGHSVTALYEVELAPNASGDLATVHLRWQDAESNEVTEIKQSATVNENDVAFEDASTNFRLAAVVAEFAESLRNSLYVDAQLGEQEISPELQWWAYLVSQAISDDEDVVELFQLIEQADRLTTP